MKSSELRKKFFKFFEKKGHIIVPSSSLVSDDPSVLLTTAGMQQFKPYFTGNLDPEADFKSRNVVSIQKCFRTSDIDEVGDESHLTFFEMLGNFSFGQYFKKEAIEYAYEFITEELGLKIDYVTIFDSSKLQNDDWRKTGPSMDQQSLDAWIKIFTKEGELSEKEAFTKIRRGGGDNFWGPTGLEGPCGPTTEIYVNGVEIWNIVFNEYYRDKNYVLTSLKNPGVDTGMGLERLAMVVQKKNNIFETDLFRSFIDSLEKNTPMSLEPNIRELIFSSGKISDKEKRIIVDHARGIIFLIADGVLPSNKDAGYILRRLIRRYIFHMYSKGGFDNLLRDMINFYRKFYPELDEDKIIPVFSEELDRFLKTLTAGLRELSKMKSLTPLSAFGLFQSYGLPFEVIKDYAEKKAIKLSREEFEKEFTRHQEISRAGKEKKFGGHGLLLDTGELKAADKDELDKVLRLHTATHLLQATLRKVLGGEVKQAGSDITPKRTRFDFSFPRKLTLEEINQIEDLVNKKIEANLPVKFVEMPKEEANKIGALSFFKGKYPDIVKVYYIGQSLDNAFSKEFCGGPHVENTGQIGKFRIVKEESVGAGIRRIRGVVNP